MVSSSGFKLVEIRFSSSLGFVCTDHQEDTSCSEESSPREGIELKIRINYSPHYQQPMTIIPVLDIHMEWRLRKDYKLKLGS